MKNLKKLAIAGAVAMVGVAANASTLVFSYSGEVNNLTIPAAYADLYDVWYSDGDFDDFYGTVIVENFEQYATGTHQINIASSNSPLKLSLVSGLLTGIEGTRQRQTGTFTPDDSQAGTTGALTITNGAVTSFTWAATGVDSPALSAFNSRTLAGFPVKISSIEVNVTGASPLLSLDGGEVLFSQSVRGTGSVTMVPEPGTYALMIAGLAAVGFVARRRAA